MKSLILTTQDARELDKLGGLTITKPIKPAPRYIEGASFSREADCADIWHLVGQDGNRLGAGDGVADVFASPVEVSDVVFIREPWYRLKNPQGGESERVILAADSVVQPEQAAYKWASPVSMPQDAARRFARVKSIEPAYGENVTPAWLIELVAITKEEATAEDGAPLSTSDVPEEASSYGCTVEEKKVHYKAGDSAPLGGLAYYKVLMRKGVKLFKGYFYPRVKAVLGNDNAATKADSITFGTNSTTFTVFRCNSDDWRITEELTTEAAAKAWVKEQLKGTVTPGG